MVIIPQLNSYAMARKRKGRLNRRAVRKMLTGSHGRFLDRLLSKAEELVKKVVIDSETYTSKTCSACELADREGLDEGFA